MIRAVAGLLHHHPRPVMAALSKMPLADLPALFTAYRHSRSGQPEASLVRLKGEDSTFRIRHGSSDFAVFCQVLLEEEYRCIPNLDDVRTIVDAGGNVGYTARYLLRRFPASRAIVIEPEASNFEAAKANLAHLADRCVVLNAALWPEPGVVTVVRDGFRDGREWSAHVEQSDGPMKVEALTMQGVMERFGIDTIDILKIDIEGAETRVFRGDIAFMSKVRCCAVELHDEDAIAAFKDMCSAAKFDYSFHSETAVAIRR